MIATRTDAETANKSTMTGKFEAFGKAIEIVKGGGVD